MKPVERSKTTKIMEKLETGNFDENDIDSLFMKLRAYSMGFVIFREVADFVAHNDKRDRGIANQSLETMYLQIKYFLEYVSPKRRLDLSLPFPIWVKRLMKFQVDKCDESQLRDKFNVTRKRLIDRIDGAFKEDKKNNLAIYRQGKLSLDTLNAIKHVLSFIGGSYEFNQNDLINELIAVLKQNKIKFDEATLRSLSNKITVCVLLLFHHTEFDFKGYKLGRCKISPEKESISHNVKFVDVDGNEVFHEESFGNLSVQGTITVEMNGKEVPISHSVMATNLSAEEWCSSDLFYIEPLSKDVPNYMCKRLKLDVDLCINDDFQLSSINT
jgi:hypothetical protein